MRQKIKYLLLIATLLVQFSCNNWMELQPPSGLIREEYWQSKEDVEAVLIGAYAKFASMDGKLFDYGELRGDMVLLKSNIYGSQRDLAEGTIYATNGYSNWADFYRVINYCNEVIANAGSVKEIDNTFTDYQLKAWVAEAYFLRSLSYFYLVRIFKDVPLVLEPSTTDNTDFYLPQTAGDAVLEKIMTDLKANRDLVPDVHATPEEDKGRATKAAFDALMADISLWRFDYQGCIDYVNKLTTIQRFPPYELLPTKVWFSLFSEGATAESIFEFVYDQDNNQGNSTYGKTNINGPYMASETAIQRLGSEYSTEAVRGYDAAILKESPTEYSIWKYVGKQGKIPRSGQEAQNCPWIIYRMGDIMLMKAEALSQLGRYNEALELINEVRDRANMSAVSPGEDASSFEDAILEERCLELAYEGKRWFDLMRMGRRNDFARKENLISIIVQNVPSTQKRILGLKLSNPDGWYLPVYKDEMERNKNLVQNSYYK